MMQTRWNHLTFEISRIFNLKWYWIREGVAEKLDELDTKVKLNLSWIKVKIMVARPHYLNISPTPSAIPKVKIIIVIRPTADVIRFVHIIWKVRIVRIAALDLCIRLGAPLAPPGPLVAHLLHPLLVVVKLKAHVYDAADPVLVESHLSVPTRIALPTTKAT